MTRTSPRPVDPSGRRRAGFTLVELLVVFVILAILIAILLPAISGAMRSAKTAATSTEISQMAQALAQFKSAYGVYPPSRIVLSETGNYSPAYLNARGAAVLSRGDECEELGPRSVSYLKRIWPKMVLSTTGPLSVSQVPSGCYDFNGDAVAPTVTGGVLTTGQIHILDGAECLVFFLGGLPGSSDGKPTVTGFAKNPANPAISALNATLGANRSTPLYEFKAGRLTDVYPVIGSTPGNGFPEYSDGLDTSTPRPFVYFSSYEGAGYDLDDVNYPEEGELADGTIVNATWSAAGRPSSGVGGRFFRSYFFTGVDTPGVETPPLRAYAFSYAPNPYTNGSARKLTATEIPEFVNKNTFQLFSAGIDGLFGIGGTYRSTADDVIPFPKGGAGSPVYGEPANLASNTRQRERDNITNFKGGRLD